MNDSCGRYTWYLDEHDRLNYGWIEPYQLWLPFDHLDFTWRNIKRSEIPQFRIRK